MAEWELTTGIWLQVDSSQPDGASQGNLVLEVEDLAAVRQTLLSLGIEVSEVEDYGFISVVFFQDPDGNQISLVEMAEE